VRMGDAITPFYDPMVAKLIVHGADRDQARRRMRQALAQTRVVGVQTNVAFLGRLMRDEAFAAADLDTGLIERRRATLLPPPAEIGGDVLALACAAVLAGIGLPASRVIAVAATAAPTDPWLANDGWRLGNSAYTLPVEWLIDGAPRQVPLVRRGASWQIDCGAGPQDYAWQTRTAAGASGLAVRVTLAGRELSGTVVAQGEQVHVFMDGDTFVLERHDAMAHAGDDEQGHAGGLAAPMPGKIVAISVKAGDAVTKGQPLLVMEAMKMEHTIAAPADGTVREIFYAVGDQVTEGAELAAIDAAEK